MSMDMHDMRMECLKLALQNSSSPREAVDKAQAYLDFVEGRHRPETADCEVSIKFDHPEGGGVTFPGKINIRT